MNFTEHALTLLGQAPAGTERDALEIALATLRGLSATHVHGISHPETKGAFKRAYSLLADIPEHPMRGRLLHGFGFVLSLRADYAEALAVADRAEALSSARNDPVLVLVTCIVHGYVAQLQGRPRAAGTWIERGLASAELLDLAPAEIFVADPQVTLLGLLGMHLLHSGFVEQGRARLEQAHARARLLGWPNTGWRPSGTRRCSRSDSATRSVSRLWPTKCARSSTNPRSRKVELRAGGFAAGRTPGWDDRAMAIA